jgi:hypothetical protein
MMERTGGLDRMSETVGFRMSFPVLKIGRWNWPRRQRG